MVPDRLQEAASNRIDFPNFALTHLGVFASAAPASLAPARGVFHRRRMIARLAPIALLLSATAAAAPPAELSRPAWSPPARVEAPLSDTPYPGTLLLEVDARDPRQGIFHARETIPVAAAGTLTLRYPEWIQAAHSPVGTISSVANLRFTAGDRVLTWRRDPVDMYAFHIDVPAGVAQVEARFDYLGPTGSAPARTIATPDMLGLQWERVLLYPAGHFVRRIAVQPTVLLPEGFTGVSALDGEPRTGRVAYPVTTVETLVDSPLFAGRHFKAWPLRPGVDLNVVAERPEDLAATPEQIEAHGRIVDQMDRLFGSRHFDRYDFLLALSEDGWRGGIEHHRSSENGSVRGYFTDWSNTPSVRGLLPHEYEHSWNGKFRRPEPTWRPDYHVPIENELLWVYEGQTSYWDIVVGVRSGMVPKEAGLGELASTAALYAIQAGRAWRPLGDTVNQPIIATTAGGRDASFPTAQRVADYYNEGALLWLDADALIRERSGGRRSLDDFARGFFGGRNGDWGVVTYRFEDLVAALNAVQPYDWARFLRDRVDRPGAPAPSGGIERGGYRIVWKDSPNVFDQSAMKVRKQLDLTHSIGAKIGANGAVSEVIWGGALFAAGLTNGATLTAVDGQVYSDDALKRAIAAAKERREPIRLLVKEGSRVRDVAVDYHGGLRWPHMEKTAQGAALLDRLLTPLGPR